MNCFKHLLILERSSKASHLQLVELKGYLQELNARLWSMPRLSEKNWSYC